LSIGTRGDIEPFLAIGQLLQDRDWEVICVFSEQFRKTVEDMGMDFQRFSKEFLELLEAKEAKMFVGGKGSLFKRMGALAKMAKAGIRLSKEIIALQHSIQVNEDPHRIIYHPKCNYAIILGNGQSRKVNNG
jgi:sterol 3beta-glucosyltransferase